MDINSWLSGSTSMRTLLKIKVQDCDHVEAMASMDLDVIS